MFLFRSEKKEDQTINPIQRIESYLSTLCDLEDLNDVQEQITSMIKLHKTRIQVQTCIDDVMPTNDLNAAEIARFAATTKFYEYALLGGLVVRFKCPELHSISVPKLSVHVSATIDHQPQTEFALSKQTCDQLENVLKILRRAEVIKFTDLGWQIVRKAIEEPSDL